MENIRELLSIKVIIMITICSIFSCADNSVDKNNKINGENSDSSANKKELEIQQINKMYLLYMNSGDFIDLASKRGSARNRLVFQFCISQIEPSRLTLRGWAGKNNGRFDIPKTESFILKTHNADNDAFDGDLFFSSQKLTKNQVDSVLNGIGDSRTKFVIFDPELNAANKHIYFDVSVQDKLPKAGEQQSFSVLLKTNPSPPASSRDDLVD